jgi:hypothetical protein
MYILVRVSKRAETNDFYLYFASDLRSDLEEIILSLYDEAVETSYEYNEAFPDTPITMEKIKAYLKEFEIYNVYYIGG